MKVLRLWALIRFALASPFLFSGVTKVLDFNGAVAEFSGLGLPTPSILVIATIVTQIGAGTLLILGYRVAAAALVLAAFTIVATALAHQPWAHTGPAFIRETTIVLEHLALTAGLCLAAWIARSMKKQGY